MDTLFEISKIVLPAIITGLFTFLITKYTYNNNRPLDKLEIAYNRIYYPLYKLIKNENTKDIDSIVKKSRYYLNKYDKYVDKSTLRAFNYLCECNTEAKKKDSYEIFKDNIYNRSSYLRRRLGYLEPGLLLRWKYLSKSEKSTIRIIFELFSVYVCLLIGTVTKDTIQLILMVILIFILIFMILESIWKFIKSIYYLIKK